MPTLHTVAPGRRLWACPFKATYHRTRADARRGRNVVTTALRQSAGLR